MVTYKVLVSKHHDHRYTARPLAWPEISEEGESEAAALEQLRARLVLLHAQSHIVDLSIPGPDEPLDDPWLRFAGSGKDDPTWEYRQQVIAAYRRQSDAETLTDAEPSAEQQ